MVRSIPLLASAALLLGACVATPGDDTLADQEDTLGGSLRIPVSPSLSGTGALAAWGGTDSSRWRPEAVLANAASSAMNDAWARPGVTDAIVAVPVRMLQSDFYEFGDGQANAAPSFEWWNEKRPPVVATLLHFASASDQVHFQFDHALPISSGDFEISYDVTGGRRTLALTATRTSAGDWVADWVVPGELGWSSLLSSQAIVVHPRGWADWFPIWFRFPVHTVADLKATAPRQTFLDGGDIQDHERMSDAANPTSPLTPYDRLAAHAFPSTYNQSPFNPQDIHAVFPYNGHSYVTAVGQGWTWVAQSPNAPFKIMYTCFEKRRADLEATAPDGGVPSGGGWHRIGDSAETILNDLESSPVLVASAGGNPVTLPSGGFSYNLTDVATFRWLRPGEAFVTRRGSASQPNYHWYLFGGGSNVCTEEWVHPCTPGDDYTMRCSSTSMSFTAQNATTSWGQNVYVVGNIPELGNWDPSRAVALSPSAYPSWTGAVALPPGATIQFKFIKRDGGGNVTWEGGGNRSAVVPDTSGQYTGSWQ